MSLVTTEMDLTEFSYQKKKEKLLKKYDLKLGQALKQGKLQVAAYYYARMTGIFDVFGRTNFNKILCPSWLKTNKFFRGFDEFDSGQFMILYQKEHGKHDPAFLCLNTLDEVKAFLKEKWEKEEWTPYRLLKFIELDEEYGLFFDEIVTNKGVD